MAYRINYHWEKERTLLTGRRISPMIWVWIAIAAAAITIRLLVPQSQEIWSGLTHPLLDEQTALAAAELIGQLRDGCPMPEAVTAFCREILSNAG